MQACKKVLASGVLCAVGLLAVFPQGADAGDIQALQGKKDQLGKKIASQKAALQSKQNESKDNAAALQEIQGEISAVQARIAQLDGEIAAAQDRIAQKAAEIAVKQKEFDARKATLSERLVAIYKNGNPKLLEVLFQSQDFSDFLTRFEYMNYIAKKDQSLLADIKAMKDALEADKAALEQEKARLDQMKAEQESARLTLAEQEKEREVIAERLKKEEAQINEQLRQMNADSAAIGAQIAELQRQAAAEAAARARAMAQNGAIAGVAANGPITVSHSGYIWPLPSSHRITSPYGPRYSPFGYGEFHMGTDIGAPNGSPIVASRSGRIIIQVYHPSYGNYVVIDHGDGYSTVYAHMSGFASSLGADVAAGQVIGFVGSTGASTGAHLHFEVRINGQHTNPMAFIG